MLKVTTGVLLAVFLLAFLSAGPIAWSVVLGVIVFAFVVSVRGYSIAEGRLLIHHPGWSTRIDLSRLVSADESPEGSFPSVRIGGIGGVFSSVGFFWNSLFGPYRAYATDGRRSVLLDMWGKRRFL